MNERSVLQRRDPAVPGRHFHGVEQPGVLMGERLRRSDVSAFTVDLKGSETLDLRVGLRETREGDDTRGARMTSRRACEVRDARNSPATKEKVTVPFSPASKSLANMFVTKEPAGRPAHICNQLYIYI